MANRPRRGLTVLLIHGAFTDASFWSPVLAQLRQAGLPARAAANPLCRLDSDAHHVARITRGIVGRVLLTGHAYGGAVITAAASWADNAVGLVYVSGYALAAGESITSLTDRFPDTLLRPALRLTDRVSSSGDGPEVVIDPAAFPTVFGADLPAALAEGLAASQRPIRLDCLTDEAPHPAWRNLPSWYLIATDDQCLHPQAQRFMAHRARSHTSETAGSHAVPVSQPAAVADVLITAAHALR